MRDETVKLPLERAGDATERPISLAIVAMGGQGGGVLTGWIVKLAENAGWIAQSTSVPGVAQRTGATIYYVEMMRPQDGKSPILAQMPTPGDVDVVIASEFIEAGRSILRGIVTPDRTTLIASSHRSLAIAEKSAPGEGIADSSAVVDAIGVTAQRQIIYDMNALAVANGSVISSAMFGALAASGALPFSTEEYHAVIAEGGKGVAASIRTFDAAYARSQQTDEEAKEALEEPVLVQPLATPPTSPRAARLVERLEQGLRPQIATMARLGLSKVVDFQDAEYGAEYLDIVEDLFRLDTELGGEAHDFELTLAGAKYVANAMAYDDVVRVADLKTRAARRGRIADEIGLSDDTIFHTTEYMHPRMEEVVGLMPAGLGRWLQNREGLYGWLDRRVSKGRRVRTYSPGWFLMLYFVAGMRGMRRSSLRHQEEIDHRDAWLALVRDMATRNYALGVETVKCRRLIKGYSDTHARGLSKFARVTNEIERFAERDDAAEWAKRLRETAIRDGEGGDLDGLIKTIRSFE
ncbi:indolepyruvate oxidoreductase subunit beta family protein [Aurantiacibacter rhizosphaerae]|uniref:Indolepyruvate oxidoreductase subunit beta family protein n=1 Tax=Aurantiacibacter rhizosphaerae TaxID=2691582 RepID=A0A844XB66_9SPHN|nr:indolepyruvate oxidoreductase subunit beta family protein [Aurantiacibacter rhizosphaerae]MWV26874.1 indolepyruvate oxidoreductase subunit beta family protein [Aurantiacibacter rhizosphaerae]